ncbi:hypothetical protein ACWGPT_19345 [Pseudorhizobium sp. NPDC055634]
MEEAMKTDLTMTEALSDPLIGLMLEADGMDKAEFAALLDKVAREQLNRTMSTLQERQANVFYSRLAAAEGQISCGGLC